MTNENHLQEDDLVLFALQFLPEDRMREARQHLAQCEMCRGEVAKLQGDLVAYAMTAEVQAPPATARERLMKQIAKEPRPVQAPQPVVAETRPVAEARPRTEPRARTEARAETEPAGEPMFAARQSRILSMEAQEEQKPRRAPWVLAWTGWAVAAGASFVAGLQMHQRQQVQNTVIEQQARLEQTTRDAAHAQDALATLTAANAKQVALHLLPVSGTKPATGTSTTTGTAAAVAPEAVAAYLADKGALVFVATHMQPVASGKAYELWLLPADGKDPIAAGTFKPDASGSGSIVLPQIPKGVAAKGFGVTVENEGGSPVPTTPVMMAGT